MKASAVIPVQAGGCRDAEACRCAVVECGSVEAEIDFAEMEELENLDRIAGEAHSGIEAVHSGIAMEGHSGLEGEGHVGLEGEGHVGTEWVAHFGTVVGHFETAEVGHFGTAEVDRSETAEVERSGMGVAVHFESFVEAQSGNWEGDRSEIEAEILAQGEVGIAVAVQSLGRSGREEVQAD